MKTAISLPDDIFRQAESAARQLKMSRSELYATAIAEFVKRRATTRVTERLNAIYSQGPAKLDPVLNRFQLHSLPSGSW